MSHGGWKIGRCPRLAGLLCVALVVLAGCARWVELHNPVEPMPVSQISVPAQARVPLVLSSVQLSRNGAAQNPQMELDRRVLTVLKETNLFSTLYQSGLVQPPAGEKIVTGRLALSERVEPHAGGAAWRGFLIGASMFTLTPLLPLEYEYGSELVLELTRWDGQSKQYRTGASGTARYHLFGATPVAIEELKGQVMEQALIALTQQLVVDADFFLLADARPASGAVRSIAVKPRVSPSKGISLVQDRESQ